MASQKHTIPLLLFFLLLLISFTFPNIEATTIPQSEGEIKCGSCPCGDSCSSSTTTPLLPLPSPPPSPPPPPPSSPPPFTYLSSQNCDPSPPPPAPPSPPPPAPRFIYVTGDPGNNVYQNQPYNWGGYYNACHNTQVGLLLLVGLITVVICLTSFSS